jgi:hypothetical protein
MESYLQEGYHREVARVWLPESVVPLGEITRALVPPQLFQPPKFETLGGGGVKALNYP